MPEAEKQTTKPLIHIPSESNVVGSIWEELRRLANDQSGNYAEMVDLIEASLEVAGAGIYWYDLATRKTVWSREVYHIYGVEPGEAIDQATFIERFCHPDDRHLHDARWASMQSQPVGSITIEFRAIRANSGQTRWVRVSTRWQQVEESYRFNGIVQDITEAKESQKRVEEDLNRLAECLADEPVVLYLIDSDMHIHWLQSPSGRPLLGTANTDFTPDPNVVAGYQQFFDAVQMVIATQQPVSYEAPYAVFTDSVIPYNRTRLTPYKMPDGRQVVLGKSYDLGEPQSVKIELIRLNQELEEKVNALEEIERRFEVATKDSLVTIWLQDENLEYVWVHNQHPSWSQFKLKGQNDYELGKANPSFAYFIPSKLKVIHESTPYAWEGEMETPDGAVVYLKTEYNPYPMPGGRVGIICKSYDLTEIWQARRQAERLSAEVLAGQAQRLQCDEWLRITLQNEPISLYVMNERFEFVYMIHQHVAWTAPLEGKPVTNAVPVEEEAAKFIELGKQVMAEKSSVTFNQWFTSPSGSRHYFRMKLQYLELPGGEPGFAAQCYDTTLYHLTDEEMNSLRRELTKKDKDLETSYERLALTLDKELISLAFLNSKLEFVHIINQHPEWTRPLEGKPFKLALDEQEEYVHFMAQIKTSLNDQINVTFNTWLTAPTGVRFYFRVAVQPTTFEDGEPGIAYKAYDITRLYLSEQEVETLRQEVSERQRELSETESKLQVALEKGPLVLYIMDEKLTVTWIYNQHSAFPVKIDNLPIQKALNVDDASAHFGAQAQRALDTLKPLTFHNWLTSTTGERVFFRHTFNPYVYPDGAKGLMCKSFDLTEYELAKHKEQELTKRLKFEQHELTQALNELSERHAEKQVELKAAAETQMQLQARGKPIGDWVDYAAHLRTSIEVGGDYYDFRQVGDRMLFAIGDATGHGLQSGLIVAMVKSYFQQLALKQQPASILDIISDAIVELGLKRLYMCLALLEYRPNGFVYTSAGMPPLLIYRHATGKVEHRLVRRMFLGTHLPANSQTQFIPMEKGDLLVAMSDGLTDSYNENNKALPYEIIEKRIAQTAPQGCQAVVDALRDLQTEWLGKMPMKDDTTLVALAIK